MFFSSGESCANITQWRITNPSFGTVGSTSLGGEKGTPSPAEKYRSIQLIPRGSTACGGRHSPGLPYNTLAVGLFFCAGHPVGVTLRPQWQEELKLKGGYSSTQESSKIISTHKAGMHALKAEPRPQ